MLNGMGMHGPIHPSRDYNYYSYILVILSVCDGLDHDTHHLVMQLPSTDLTWLCSRSASCSVLLRLATDLLMLLAVCGNEGTAASVPQLACSNSPAGRSERLKLSSGRRT